MAEGFYALEHSDAAMEVDPVEPLAGAQGKMRAGASKNAELLVETQEDLKALTRVRKMMLKGETWRDPKVKATLMGYFEGDMIVVSRVASLRAERVA